MNTELRSDARLRRLLVVDGADDVLSSVGARLRGRGWRVFCASSAVEGVLVAAREPLSVILLDGDLSDAPGLQAVSEFKRLAATPVVLMTSHEDQEREREARSLGACGVLRKPLDLDALEACLESVAYA